MRILGAHMSIAGGVSRAVDRGEAVGCDAIQIFTASGNRWAGKPIDGADRERFAQRLAETGIGPVLAHGSYLINLASPDRTLRRRSIRALREEMARCAVLGVPALVIHPGAHMGRGEAAGCARIADALDGILEASPPGVRILLETTAGQGSSLGHRFEHLRDILAAMRRADRVGVCFDTCHVFAAGYDFRTRRGYDAVMRDLDERVGLARVEAFHLNDSLKDLGCRVDRHAHIGRGFLGDRAFGFLLNDLRFRDVPMVLETPKGPDGEEDRVNLRLLRSLCGPRKGRAASAGRAARRRAP